MDVEDSKENEKICRDFCWSCPTYPESGEWLFCARGKSARKIARNGCLCPACQVYVNYGLSSNYYCAEGSPR